jgi:hypothetical protein
MKPQLVADLISYIMPKLLGEENSWVTVSHISGYCFV